MFYFFHSDPLNGLFSDPSVPKASRNVRYAIKGLTYMPSCIIFHRFHHIEITGGYVATGEGEAGVLRLLRFDAEIESSHVTGGLFSFGGGYRY